MQHCDCIFNCFIFLLFSSLSLHLLSLQAPWITQRLLQWQPPSADLTSSSSSPSLPPPFPLFIFFSTSSPQSLLPRTSVTPGLLLSPSDIMAGEKGPIKRSTMDIKRLASLIQRGTGRLLVIDSRTFSEYNASHVQGAVNVCCSKLVKRRLQQDKVSVTELLQPNGKVKVSSSSAYLQAMLFGVMGCDASD